MFSKRGFTPSVITILFSLMFAFAVYAGNGNGHWENGPSVEEIYNSIRNSAPQYQGEESIVTFQNEGMTLVCSLTIPNTREKAPIVITLNGFGGDRDDMVIPGTDEPYFKRFSRILAENGIASLRVDFRGSGESDGEFQMTTFSTQISDTIAAIDYIENNLKQQVDTDSIGLTGFSQGGLVAAVTASKDKRVDFVVLWSPVTHPPIIYQGLLTTDGIKSGLAMEDGEWDMFGVYINGQYVYWDLPLGKGFFEELFTLDPLAEIRNYKEPLMVISGINDPIVWPQPAMGQLYLTYHDGFEKSIELDADHAFNMDLGPEVPDTTFYWSAAWCIRTFKRI